jgi:hypothetical protein
LKEHHWHIQLEHVDKWTMAQHSINLGHWPQLRNINILSTKLMYESH